MKNTKIKYLKNTRIAEEQCINKKQKKRVQQYTILNIERCNCDLVKTNTAYYSPKSKSSPTNEKSNIR